VTGDDLRGARLQLEVCGACATILALGVDCRGTAPVTNILLICSAVESYKSLISAAL
jgi:hypothetical protein